MAPLKSAKAERDGKLKSLLGFVRTVAERIETNPPDSTLLSEIQRHINSLPLPHSSAVSAKQDELDREGTDLWNLATRLRRDGSSNGKSVHTHLRVFAFLLLDSAYQGTRPTSQNCVRLLKVALKAAKHCIEQKQFDPCMKLIERAAHYEGQLAKCRDRDAQDIDGLRGKLKAEYFVLRTTLAWKQSRLDLAEHMFSKADLSTTSLDPASAESLADLLYEVGKDLAHKKQDELAVRWLERAYDLLTDQDLEDLSGDAGELKLSVLHSLIRANLKIDNPESRARAWDLLNLMESDYGDKMVVSLLKLELIASDQTFDSDAYFGVLLRMIRSLVLTRSNFKTIMHHVHKLKEHNPEAACKVLDNFLALRLYGADKDEWLEKTVVTRLWISTSAPGTDAVPDDLKQFLDDVSENSLKPLDIAAVHAAQTLLWKRIESAHGQGLFDIAESWCILAAHQLFERCGELNKAKIARKIILCALGRLDLNLACQIFFEMSESAKAAPLTRYLMYKVALRNGDVDLAAECIDVVCKISTSDATLLYACVLEAQRTGDKKQAIHALKKVLQLYEKTTPPGVNPPALLRCTTKLIMAEMTADTAIDDAAIEDLCKIFDMAAAQGGKSRRRQNGKRDQEFSQAEISWFSRNNYNLALKFCGEIHPEHLLRLLTSCMQTVEFLQQADSFDPDDNLSLRLLFCEFLAACASVTLARAEDNVESSLQHYLRVRQHAQSYRTKLADYISLNTLSQAAREDLVSKNFGLLKLELEAVLKLNRWDDLDGIFRECWRYENPGHWDTLADLVLVIHSVMVAEGLETSYRSKLLIALQKIIKITVRGKHRDLEKLSRWIRCLYQMALSTDEEVSLRCLDEATCIAQKHQHDSPYPSEELQWLATSSFNRAVDYYCADDDVRCKMWGERALTLAATMKDQTELYDLLMKRYSELAWEK